MRLLDMGATYIEIPTIPKERTAGRTKAFTVRNICAVAHTLLEIMIRRVGRMLYPKYVGSLQHSVTLFETPAFQKATGRPPRHGMRRSAPGIAAGQPRPRPEKGNRPLCAAGQRSFGGRR